MTVLTNAIGALGLSSLVALAASSGPAHAMSYSYHVYKGGLVVHATGDITADEAALFNEFAQRAPVLPVYLFELNSTGGNVAQALALSNMVEGSHWNTSVAAGGVCASACVVVWAAGGMKFVSSGARIGVHMVATPYGATSGLSEQELISARAAIDATVAARLTALGAPSSVVMAATTVRQPNTYWLTRGDLAAWGAIPSVTASVSYAE